jgi:hypothetical protein
MSSRLLACRGSKPGRRQLELPEIGQGFAIGNVVAVIHDTLLGGHSSLLNDSKHVLAKRSAPRRVSSFATGIVARVRYGELE